MGCELGASASTIAAMADHINNQNPATSPSAARLPIAKTFKLYIGGAFPRSESGRSVVVNDGPGRGTAHACLASRKDLREAVVAARKAQGGWAKASAYNRGQVLYRMAEMLEGKASEFVQLLRGAELALDDAGAKREVAASVDRLVAFAGWADKYHHILGGQNAVAGPYWNITVPEPTGVFAVIPPASPKLLGLVTMLAPVICAGNAAVVIAACEAATVASTFGEVCHTSDVPGGVVNILTGQVDELLPIAADHRDVDGIHALGLSAEHAKRLRLGTADNLKRVTIQPASTDVFDARSCCGPWWIEPFVEFKTVWHPVGA